MEMVQVVFLIRTLRDNKLKYMCVCSVMDDGDHDDDDVGINKEVMVSVIP